jgi:hypothetical protein
MSPRLRLIIIIAAIVLVVGGGVWLVYTKTRTINGLVGSGTLAPKNSTPTTTSRFIDSSNFNTSTLAEVANVTPVPAASTTGSAPTVEIEKKGVESFARVFTQIYGSFSSDNSYQNVYDVQTLVTPQLWAKIKPPATSKTPATSFTGVTTVVLLAKLTAWNTTSATVEVEATRTETKAGKTTVFNQKATVMLVKQGENWLVDSFAWIKL